MDQGRRTFRPGSGTMPLQTWARTWNCAIAPMADGAMLPDWTNCGVFLDLRGAQFFAPA
jgi:hypothetical protein